jgi:nitrogen regulatory protein PII
MTDLRVSYDRLEESTRNLKSIQRELEDTEHHQKDISEVLGSGHMAHAMDDFAGNWDYHRHKLLDKIQAMGEMAEKTLEAFKDVDQKLRDGVAGDGKDK